MASIPESPVVFLKSKYLKMSNYAQIFKIFGDVHSIIIIIGCHNNGYRDLYDVKKKIGKSIC